jgi:hypothetical protein
MARLVAVGAGLSSDLVGDRGTGTVYRVTG